MEFFIDLLLIIAATAYVCYVTIQGYRTGVLKVRTRIGWSREPTLIAMVALCLACLGAVAC